MIFKFLVEPYLIIARGPKGSCPNIVSVTLNNTDVQTYDGTSLTIAKGPKGSCPNIVLVTLKYTGVI